MDQMVDSHLGLGLNGQVGHLRPVTSPWLKLPTQSQMVDSDIKVPDLKVCVQNVKFIAFHMNL